MRGNPQVTKHAQISRRIADIIGSTDKEKDQTATLRIGCPVLFNALAFHDRLASAMVFDTPPPLAWQSVIRAEVTSPVDPATDAVVHLLGGVAAVTAEPLQSSHLRNQVNRPHSSL